MNKSALVQARAAATEQFQTAASKSLEAFVKIVSEELARGGEAAIPVWQLQAGGKRTALVSRTAPDSLWMGHIGGSRRRIGL